MLATGVVNPLRLRRANNLQIKIPRLKRALVVLFSAVLQACSTTQKAEITSVEAGPLKPTQYQMDLFVNEAGRSFKLKADLSTLSALALRLDVFTTLDLPLASVIMSEREIRYALYRDKKFYQGPVNPHALDPVFPLSVEGRDLVSILNERPLPSQKCERDEAGFLVRCTATKPLNYTVEWGKRADAGPLKGRATRISLLVPDRKVELKFYLKSSKPLLNPDRLTQITVPSDFQTRPVPTH